MKKISDEFKTAKQYINFQDEKLQKPLRELYSFIKSLVPEAQEKISYQIPCFNYLYSLVGVGTTKTAVSFYTMNPKLVKSMSDELNTKNIKFSGSTLHFSPNEPLPLEVIKSIVLTRKTENEFRDHQRKSKRKK